MRRIGFYLFIIAVFLLAPLLALPQKAVPAPAAVPTPAPTAVARAAAPYRAVCSRISVAVWICSTCIPLSPLRNSTIWLSMLIIVELLFSFS